MCVCVGGVLSLGAEFLYAYDKTLTLLDHQI